MAVIRPFRALRPPAERAQAVASVPYDVVNTEEARALAEGNPLSFLHVSRPEIDLPPGTDIYSDAVYRKAVDNFEKLIATCPLEKEAEPSLYLYRLIMGQHEQIGVVACCSIDEYDNDTIRKHERTRRDKEDDRTRHMLMLRAQTGPVFLTYRRRAEIDEQVNAAITAPPLFDITAGDGIRHTIWRLAQTEGLVNSFASVPLLYIADGHHRAASASRARAELRNQSFAHTGNEDYNYFLTVIFPDSQLQILAYNRIVKDLNGLSKDDFLEAVRRQFTITDNASPAPKERGNWSMHLDGKWYGLQLSPETTLPTGTVQTLDVSILQDRLLDPVLGIKDIRTDKRVDFVGGLRGTKELERLVNEGKAAVAFSLYPTTVAELLMVSDANEIMPPKSTWFEPKLRDGLLIHSI
ncbi:MAG TPA: DUF1015 family protein [Pyrinomonadaceae bacterium]|nr:DUF1015 family protein [Pyrinomonadaceae bacterium]